MFSQETKKVISHLQDVNPDIKIILSNIAPRGDDGGYKSPRLQHKITQGTQSVTECYDF